VAGATTRRSASREEIVENPVSGQAFDGKLRHETLRRFGHHHLHKKLPLAQTPDKIEHFIRRDAAADD
jgi:hypothetical protein